MAKNTLSNAFRKIDVDQFNEDNFKEDDVPNETSFGKVNESEIAGLLSKGNASEALKILLSSAPIGSKNQADKVRNWCCAYFNSQLRLKYSHEYSF